MKDKETKLTLINEPLAVSVDGHRLQLNNDTGEVDISFFQISPVSTKDEITAAVVSHLRMPIGSLRRLILDASNLLDDFEERKK